ncbi:MAG TPA: hypothetical protein VL426_04595 [Candidatus Binatia bacterium]|jgi:hypothetical protein|nr:hypothetical protein [Candidatus Binatia bacterium]
MPDEPPKDRLRRLIERMPLDRQHKERLFKDLETIDDAKATQLADDLAPIVEKLDLMAHPPKTKA